MALVRASRAVIRSVCSGHSVGGTRGALARPVHCKVHACLRPCRARASSTLARSASVGAGTSNATAASSGDEAPNDDAWGTPEVVPGASVRVTPRATDYSAWYQDVIAAAEMVDHAPVRGCMVLRPHGYAVWESIKEQLDGMIKATGHVNAYFPLLIPQVSPAVLGGRNHGSAARGTTLADADDTVRATLRAVAVVLEPGGGPCGRFCQGVCRGHTL